MVSAPPPSPITLLVLGPMHPDLPGVLQQLRLCGVLAVHTDKPSLARQWLSTLRPDQLMSCQALEGAAACPMQSWDGDPASLLAAWTPKPEPEADLLWGSLWLAPKRRLIASQAAPEHRICVPATEMRLLLCLVRQQGRGVSREQLIAEVWPDGPRPQARSIDQVVRRLREVLRQLGLASSLRSLHGLGYRLDGDPQPPLASQACSLV